MTTTAGPAYQQIADALRERILTGQLSPGERLPKEEELARGFGVSRSTVREALRALATQRLVVTTRGVTGGTAVADQIPPDVSHSLIEWLEWSAIADQISVSELLQAREMLEVPASGLAAANRTPDQLERLAATLETEISPSRPFESTRRFHLLVVETSGNRLLEPLTRPLFVVLQDRFLRDLAPASFWMRVDEEHRLIYDAIAAGDRLAAEYEMREHLQHLRRMYEQIDRHR